ncbi:MULTISPECIES: ATP-binding protein [unclassified Streptomyces]|uniref:ATP-binding protein n=1 Tax=unclassified Streptomyces TaxID=2593676 RepID=UPI003409A825
MASSHDAFLLAAQGAAVAEARRRVRARLRDWGVAEGICDDAVLVVSELFTNAVRHSGGEKVACAVRVERGVVRVEVADQGIGLTAPQVKVADVGEECGRGLLLVGAVSRAWGVVTGPDGTGRVVWAELGAATDLP